MISRSLFFLAVYYNVLETALGAGPKPPPPPPPPPPPSSSSSTHRRYPNEDNYQHRYTTRSQSRSNIKEEEEGGHRRKRSDGYNPKFKEDRRHATLTSDNHDFEQRNDDQRRPSQRPKLATSSEQIPMEQPNVYNPIDYNFPSMQISPPEKESLKLEDDLPQTGSMTDLEMNPTEDSSDSRNPRKQEQKQTSRAIDFGNARKDATARYGRMRLSIASAMVGASLGLFIGQSLLSQGKSFAIIFGFLFMLMSFLRNDYGEMARSLGLALIYIWKRTRLVRKKYKTGMHVKAICRMRSRVPFPPTEDGMEENPWKYTPQSDRDPDFEMIKSMLCLLLVGSFCGGNMPLIPTWMGSAGGAATFAVFALGRNPRGDLFRTIGMRLVALIDEAVSVNTELNVTRKVIVVVSKVIDKLMILDRKHRIRDKLFKGAAATYDTLSSTISRVQDDIQDKKVDSTKSRRNRPPQRSRPSRDEDNSEEILYGSNRKTKGDDYNADDRLNLGSYDERRRDRGIKREDDDAVRRTDGDAPGKVTKKRGFFF